ncbi:MAG TPA: phosphatase PAP2 family protein [Lentibacillus sp.]|uniref:phosphatase PAP2 family protein n=1 Tax=Lentibacillus sp. TaxID=1925746 RepID=UPI002B4AF820|nr:phosphatase PAP2 family protein [Lentibacillus sp.]HLR63460.1 phosphatase PAP2 family protein [Lentibacillus sp.]
MSRKSIYFIIGLAVVMFMIFIIWNVKIMAGVVPYVDQWSRGFVANIADSTVYLIFRWITELGSKSFLLPFTIIMSLFLWYLLQDWLAGFLFASGTLGSHLLNTLIKGLVERERPRILLEANAEGYSFPSGHAMTSLVCYGLFVYFIVKKITSQKTVLGIKIAFALLVFLIGISRYIINVHYLTDVIAGFTIGGLYLTGMVYLFELIQKRRSNDASFI